MILVVRGGENPSPLVLQNMNIIRYQTIKMNNILVNIRHQALVTLGIIGLLFLVQGGYAQKPLSVVFDSIQGTKQVVFFRRGFIGRLNKAKIYVEGDLQSELGFGECYHYTLPDISDSTSIAVKIGLSKEDTVSLRQEDVGYLPQYYEIRVKLGWWRSQTIIRSVSVEYVRARRDKKSCPLF